MNADRENFEEIAQAAHTLAECGERGRTCWALGRVLDEVIQGVGPWELAHYLVTTKRRRDADALSEYLAHEWADTFNEVEQLIAAVDWTPGEGLRRDFGEA